jgi:hypothetical protein
MKRGSSRKREIDLQSGPRETSLGASESAMVWMSTLATRPLRDGRLARSAASAAASTSTASLNSMTSRISGNEGARGEAMRKGPAAGSAT